MDVWVHIASYLIRPNPACKKRGGALLACASTVHRAAVELAVHMAAFSACSHPIVRSYDRRMLFTSGHPKKLRFCKECPGQFEVRDPGAVMRYAYRCPCATDACLPRFTHCLATINCEECLHCGEESVVDDSTVVELMHRIDCGGCLARPPDMCRACFSLFMSTH